jgi:hypothetical protein
VGVGLAILGINWPFMFVFNMTEMETVAELTCGELTER